MDKDIELVQRFRSGDVRAFEMLFNTHYKALVGYGRTIVKDQEEAEDIVQQVFVSVWEKRTTMIVHTSFRAMLYSAVHNASLNRIKHQSVKREHARHVTLTGTSIGSSYEMQYRELQTRINKAIDQLPEQCARIFKMSRFDELKYQEIADKLGLSVKTVENQMGKALKVLREDLKEYLTIIVILILKRYL